MNKLPTPRAPNWPNAWKRPALGHGFSNPLLGYLFALPLLAVLVGLLAYPLLSAAGMSFQDKETGRPGVFVGAANYIKIFTVDKAFPELVFNTVTYALVAVVVKLCLGSVMAFVLNEAIPGRNFFRAWLLFPWIAPVLVTALTWRWMFDQTGGVINYVIATLGWSQLPPAWLAEKGTALFAVIVANVWRGFPFFGITLLAGLQTIPAELYEAAEIDGAGVWQRIRHVALPQLEPIIVTVVTLSTIWTFNDFPLIWVMTQGGPGYGTHLFVTYAYQTAFRDSRLGYAAATSFAALPLMLVLVLYLAPRLWRDEE